MDRIFEIFRKRLSKYGFRRNFEIHVGGQLFEHLHKLLVGSGVFGNCCGEMFFEKVPIIKNEGLDSFGFWVFRKHIVEGGILDICEDK